MIGSSLALLNQYSPIVAEKRPVAQEGGRANPRGDRQDGRPGQEALRKLGEYNARLAEAKLFDGTNVLDTTAEVLSRG